MELDGQQYKEISYSEFNKISSIKTISFIRFNKVRYFKEIFDIKTIDSVLGISIEDIEKMKRYFIKHRIKLK